MFKVLPGLVVAGLSFGFGAAFACSCAPPGSPQKELELASAVFSGKVTDISPADQYSNKVTLRVEKAWKGASSLTISVLTSSSSAACGNSYEVGQTWLVYAHGKENLSTSLCSRTAPIEHAKEDLAALGPGKTPAAPTAS